MLDVHVTAPFRILRAAAEPWRTMSRREAAEGREVIRKVVNISSMAGTHGNAGQVNYSSAKAALVGMTKTLSKELGSPEGLRQLRRVRLYRHTPHQGQ